MTWWLSASDEALKAASTCTECGCSDADIDLNLCYDCFQRLPESEKWRRNLATARKYNLPEQIAKCEAKMFAALAATNGRQEA